MKGVIYKAYCSITDKCYIGFTILSLKKRISRHFDDAFNRNKETHFARALRKYGKENFQWSIVDSIDSNTKETLVSCLKILEIKYIKQYDSYVNGYNSTPGGDSITDISKPVKVYNELGEFIQLFDSRKEASVYYKISEDCVSAGCIRRLRFSYVDGKRIIFRNEEDTVTESDISLLKLLIHNPKCKILAYDYDTNQTIKVFDSIKEGASFFGLKSSSSITEIVNGSLKRKTSGRYNGHKVGWLKILE